MPCSCSTIYRRFVGSTAPAVLGALSFCNFAAETVEMQYAQGGSEVRSSFMPLVGRTPWLIQRQYSPSTFYSAAGAGDARWRVGCLRRLADVDVCLRLVAHLHPSSSMRTFRRHHVPYSSFAQQTHALASFSFNASGKPQCLFSPKLPQNPPNH